MNFEFEETLLNLGLEDAVAKLLDKGADPQLKNTIGETSFDQVFPSFCLHVNDSERVDRLMNCLLNSSAFKNPFLGTESSVIHDAIYWMNAVTPERVGVFIRCLELILKSAPFIDVNVRNKDGLTPLQFAARMGITSQIVV